MKNFRLQGSLVALFIVLFGCNIFNPSGTNDSGGEENADALISYGDALMRDGSFSEAEAQFDQAIKLDSNKSMAYYGKAKAIIRKYNINPATLMSLLNAPEANEIPFVNSELALRKALYESMVQLRDILGLLIYRDSLSEIWNLKQRSEDEDFSPDRSERKRIQWLEDQLAADGLPWTSAKFPLSDRRIKQGRVVVELTTATLIASVLRIFDLNGDGFLDDNDQLLEGVSIELDSNGNVQINGLDELLSAAILNDTVKNNYNATIDSIAQGLGDAGDLSSIFGDLLGQQDNTNTSDDASNDLNNQLSSEIEKLGPAIAFYKMGDGEDNDGDGCIDEEIQDSIDNDGDGYVDEDIRVLYPENDFVDNDRDGIVGNADEALGSDKILLFASISGFVGTKFQDETTKLAIATDTGAVKKYSLSERQSLIGGCWLNMSTLP